jgi:nucleotide-binding universal stress UspA family protein
MFNHILVPLDGSILAECVLPHLVSIARVGAPRVTLLRVLDPNSSIQGQPGFIDPFDWQLRKAEAETYVKDIALRLEGGSTGALPGEGVGARAVILEGRAAETIVEYSQNEQVDLILLSSHGQSGLSGWNVSSVVQKVILRARTSVMIVRAYQPASTGLGGLDYNRILLPLDGSARAEVVLPVAAAIARSLDGTLVAAHIVRQPEIPRRTPPTPEDLELAARLDERNRLEASGYLEELPSRLDARVETRLSVERNVIAALQRIAEQESAQLVILSAHGYSGEAQVPYGSVVTGFIAFGALPLLIIQDLPAEQLEPSPAEVAARESRWGLPQQHGKR